MVVENARKPLNGNTQKVKLGHIILDWFTLMIYQTYSKLWILWSTETFQHILNYLVRLWGSKSSHAVAFSAARSCPLPCKVRACAVSSWFWSAQCNWSAVCSARALEGGLPCSEHKESGKRRRVRGHPQLVMVPGRFGGGEDGLIQPCMNQRGGLLTSSTVFYVGTKKHLNQGLFWDQSVNGSHPTHQHIF